MNTLDSNYIPHRLKERVKGTMTENYYQTDDVGTNPTYRTKKDNIPAHQCLTGHMH